LFIQAHRFRADYLSLYTSTSVTLHFGPTHQIYYLPEILLRRLENIPSRDPRTHEIYLVDVDASIGHVLVHFLHTGVYQTLNDEAVEDADNTHKSLVRNEFQTALLALEAARKYSVPGLQELAKIELERRGNEMSLCDPVGAIREEFVAGPSDEHAWLQDFVSRKVRWTFEQDQPMFSAPDFFENIESPTLTQLLAQSIVGLYSEDVEKLRKGKAATDKISTPEHSEPLGIYPPHLPRLPPKGIAATSTGCLASVEKFEAFDDSAAAWDPKPEPVVDESSPAREEDLWGGGGECGSSGWGAATAGTKKKKGRKGDRELKPELEFANEDAGLNAELSRSQAKELNATLNREAKLKKEEDTKRQKEEEEAVEVRRQEKEETEQIRRKEEEAKVKKVEEEEAAAAAAAAAAETGVSSFDSAIETGATSKDDNCESRSEHLSRENRWQNCKLCELCLRKIALKLYKEGLPNVNGFSTTNMQG
jgi:hypothetical protein